MIEFNIIQAADEGILTESILSKLNNFMVAKQDCIFVDIKTDCGTLQLAVYNSHNGYYGHEVLIRENNVEYLRENL